MQNFSELLGKTLTDCVVEDDVVKFSTSDGGKYRLVHDPDCCEHVYVEDVIGDINDLLNFPLLMAEEVVYNQIDPEEVGEQDDPGTYRESFTWTFYKLATVKGYVTIRWYGESNGYYSESVSFYEDKNPLKMTAKLV